MNVNKSMMKVDLAKSIGSKYADMVKEAEKDQLRQEGARDALKLAVERVGDLGLHVDKDLEEGVLSASDLKDPKKVEMFIKRFIKRAVGVVDNLATTAEIARTVASGRTKGLQSAENYVRKLGEAEVARLQELEKQIGRGELTLEDVGAGGHPGLSLKHQREDEKSASEATSKPKASKKSKRKKPVPKKKG